MPPKVKITKEAIVHTAVEIVREQGAAALNARDIAAKLKCSTQPVFSNFSTMEELHWAVVADAEILFEEYMQRECEQGSYPAYKATGMAYIRFAREEKELFKLLYMRDRGTEDIPKETELGNMLAGMVQHNTGVTRERAELFHLEMWAYVHGIAVMIATGFLDLEQELISRMLTDAYQGLKKHYEGAQEYGSD